MEGTNNKLYQWRDCLQMDIAEVQDLYARYINKRQVDMVSSFGFGRALVDYSEGMYIYTKDGRKILDFTGGQGVLSHGHNHPRILKARLEFQAEKRMEVHKHFFSQYMAVLAHNIAQLMPADLDVSYFCNSGAEAVEGAVKLAYKYFDGKKKYILHSDISFHGKLLVTGGLGGSPELDYPFPTIPNVESFKFNDIQSVTELVARLKRDDGESDVYAIILEPFNASSLSQCSTEFLLELRQICNREKIVLIFDEIYTGWAKTGELFYFFKHDVVPDIVTFSKSFGGGKSSISGYTTRTPISKGAYGSQKDAVMHSTTYNGFGEETVTAIEAINVMIEEDYVGKSKHIYKVLNAGLNGLKEKYPDLITEVNGSGSLNGIVLNKDIYPALKAALNFVPGDLFKDDGFIGKLITAAVMSDLFNSHGILTSFGENKNITLFVSPSLIVSDEEIKIFVDALDNTLSKGKLKLLVGFATQKFLKK
ncbi:MAG: aminotransferase class III-fold pyridoxal phosphate-dependent enzyme [Deltaproteobacteria bacterium]|nr:aminotransferase class III-fold pyridoxal phosphate-dependent enzyme [Deltaproteobacteria bacterium]